MSSVKPLREVVQQLGNTFSDPQNREYLSQWSAEIPGKIVAKAKALSGPMTPPGKRVQTINPPGSEVGPGTVATWGKAITDEVDALGFKWEWNNRSSKHIPFDWSGP
jgi:hypothetical protein